MLGDLVATFTVPLLEHPVSQQLLFMTFYSGPSLMWQAMYGLWIAVFLRSTMRHIYVPFAHQLILAFLSSLVGDQVLFAQHDMRTFLTFTAAEFTVVGTILTCFNLCPEKYSNMVLRQAVRVMKLVGPFPVARAFHRIPSYFEKSADERVLLVGALVMMFWVNIIDAIANTLTGMRAGNVFSTRWYVMRQGFAAACAFALSRSSPLANILGIYPFPYTSYLLLLVLLVLNMVTERKKCVKD